MAQFVPKPVHRSRLRMLLGQTFFRMKRWWAWSFSGTRWAKTKADPSSCPYTVAVHQTPLLRQLSQVEMWLQHNKVSNLKLATARVTGILLKPGETFSYWRLIGNPTARKGYVPGMALHNGEIQVEVAGGLCQLSNLIYWLTLHTPLTIVERWRHNYDVFPDADRVLPFGSGATCFYNYIDLQIRNDTDQEFLLRVTLTDTHLVGEWRSSRPVPLRYQVYETEHRIQQEFWGGYTRHNQLRRRVMDETGEQVADQFVTENHAVMMYQPLLQSGTGE